MVNDNIAPPLKIKSDKQNYDIWKLILEQGSLDVDKDLVDYSEDNCPIIPNGPALGTCTDDITVNNCTKNTDCGEGDVCSMDQEDFDNDNIGDVCDNCTDTDGDGFGNPGFGYNTCPLDNCPNSDLRETIIISGCDSRVKNLLFDGVSDGGCTMSDFIDECKQKSRRHGRFVKCVAHLTNDWKNKDLIRGREKGAIQRCAGQANEKRQRRSSRGRGFDNSPDNYNVIQLDGVGIGDLYDSTSGCGGCGQPACEQ
jgi:hypothetical protein